MLAAGRDLLVAQAAQRALVLAAEVRAADEKVRAGTTEQTVVRGFSRRFYEALSGGGSKDSGERIEELDADELEEIDEEGDEVNPLSALPTLITGDAGRARGGSRSAGGSGDDTTNPTPRSVLPGEGR
jgi:hypothetical protein